MTYFQASYYHYTICDREQTQMWPILKLTVPAGGQSPGTAERPGTGWTSRCGRTTARRCRAARENSWPGWTQRPTDPPLHNVGDSELTSLKKMTHREEHACVAAAAHGPTERFHTGRRVTYTQNSHRTSRLPSGPEKTGRGWSRRDSWHLDGGKLCPWHRTGIQVQQLDRATSTVQIIYCIYVYSRFVCQTAASTQKTWTDDHSHLSLPQVWTLSPNIPMQLLVHMEWWSCLATQASQ